MDELGDRNGYLELSSHPIRFEPVSKVTNVFFDDTSKEVLSVRAGGTLGVVVRGVGRDHTFRMEDRGTISSLKFSPDHTVLAVQRNKNSVELLSYNDGEIGPGCVQECRAKGANLLGFIWTNNDDLVLVTNSGVEFYQIQSPPPEDQADISSYVMSLLPGCSCVQGGVELPPSSLQVWWVMRLKIHTWNSLDLSSLIDVLSIGESYLCSSEKRLIYCSLCSGKEETRLIVKDREYEFCASAYCSSYKELVVSGSRCPGTRPVTRGSQCVIDRVICRASVSVRADRCWSLQCSFMSHRVSHARRMHRATLARSRDRRVESTSRGDLERIQSFRDQKSRHRSLLRKEELRKVTEPHSGEATTFHALVCNGALRCLHLLLWYSGGATKPNLKTNFHVQSESQKSLREVISKRGVIVEECKSQLVDSLLSRRKQEYRGPTNVTVIEYYADVITRLYDIIKSVVLVIEMMSAVCTFMLMSRAIPPSVSSKLVVGVVIEYIRSLGAVGVTVQHFLYELVINALVRSRQFYQLHQLLQYHVLADSKPLACLLLSLVSVYSAGKQLSLDMLCRLNTAHDEIIEVLLSQHQVIPALRYARSVGLAETVSARKFLEAAMICGDSDVFYSTFNFFGLRNAKLRGSSAFAKGEHCDMYVEHFKKLFGEIPDYTIQQT
nr:uncharacterized protein LOC113805462 [Penaeus vannamei]